MVRPICYASLAPAQTLADSGQPRVTGSILSRRNTVLWVHFGVLAALLLALYLKIGIKLVHDWVTIPDYSYGILVPFIAAYILYERRHELVATPRHPSWIGLSLMLLGLLLLLGGVFGADLFLSRSSFLLVTAGLVWTLLGSPTLRRLRFVFFVMLLAIPLPAILLNQITFPLQVLSSRLAAALLSLSGVPVLREGNIIQLAALPLEVAEACSGIRSLMCLFTLAVIYGYFAERGTSRRVLLAITSIPIAVAGNVARIFFTGLCVQYWNPERAKGFFHEFSGWLMFLFSLGCLYLAHITMARFLPQPAELPPGPCPKCV